MTAKTSARRKAAFLKALRETGNQTIAAERAKVSRSWVVKHRREHSDFDAAVRAAVAEAKGFLDKLGGKRPPSGWGYLDGEELVVRGTNRRRTQVARARVNEISPRVEKRFLSVLGATCNVKAAYTAAGVSKGAIYSHAKRWPGFARRWEETLDDAMMRLDWGLLEAGMNLFSGDEAAPDCPIRRMTASEAVYILEMHKRRRAESPRAAGAPSLRASEGELTRALELGMRALGGETRSEEEKARDRSLWARRRYAG